MEVSVKRKIFPINISGMFSGFKGGWYLVDYIPKSPDKVSTSIIGYKLGDEPLSSRWNAFALKHICNLDIAVDYVVRALAAGELISDGRRPLDDLCRRVAAHFRCVYDPGMLVKRRKNRALHTMLKAQRQKELQSVYEVSEIYQRDDPCNILIVDDVLTTGSTINAIRKALRKRFPLADIYFFTLAKTINRYAKEQAAKYPGTLKI